MIQILMVLLTNSFLVMLSIWGLKKFDTKSALLRSFIISIGSLFIGGYIFFVNRNFDFSKPLDLQSPGGGLGIEYSREFFPLMLFIGMVISGLFIFLFQWHKYKTNLLKS